MRSLQALILTLFFPIVGVAQPETVLSDFYAVQANKHVVLKWVMTQGVTCFGIEIFRSDDSINYDPIGFIPGVCGSNSAEEAYSFADTAPVPNKKVYYKLSFGGLSSSEIIAFEFISVNAEGYSILPEPANRRTNILYLNPSNTRHDLTIFDMNGRSIGIISSNSNKISIDYAHLPDGIYLFILTSEGKSVTGRLILY